MPVGAHDSALIDTDVILSKSSLDLGNGPALRQLTGGCEARPAANLAVRASHFEQPLRSGARVHAALEDLQRGLLQPVAGAVEGVSLE